MNSTLSLELPYLWTHQDIDALNSSRDFHHIGEITLDVLKRSAQPVTMVSGPISSGGLGKKNENLPLYKKAGKFLEWRGVRLFNQLPSEMALERHYAAWLKSVGLEPDGEGLEIVNDSLALIQPDDPYCWDLLVGIYEPLFRSGKVQFISFMPTWLTSRGSKWEHDMACHLGIPIGYLPSGWEEEYDSAH